MNRNVQERLIKFVLSGSTTPNERYLLDLVSNYKNALENILSCEYVIDPVTVPKQGIELAPPYHVVGTLHVSLTRLEEITKALDFDPEEIK